MDLVTHYNPEDYLETLSGNKLHKRALIKGSDQIQLQGKVIMKSGLIIRGDLSKVSMGKYVALMENVTLKPSYKRQKQIKFVPITIGDYVMIDQNTIIQAGKIGSYVQIGKNCIISHRAIIGDNVIILDDSTVAPETVVPSYSVYGGRPAVFMAELPETTSIVFKDRSMNFYKNFLPLKPAEKK